MNVSESWSVAFWIALVIALVLIVLFSAAFWACVTDDGLGEGALGSGAIVVACVLWIFLPWGIFVTGGSDYHKFKPKSGEVVEVGKRLVPNGKSMEEKIVIRFKDDPQEYGVTDTRAALLKPGDTAVVKCKLAYQFGSTPGYDCRWVSRTPKGSN